VTLATSHVGSITQQRPDKSVDTLLVGAVGKMLLVRLKGHANHPFAIQAAKPNLIVDMAESRSTRNSILMTRTQKQDPPRQRFNLQLSQILLPLHLLQDLEGGHGSQCKCTSIYHLALGMPVACTMCLCLGPTR
jgi:hypothetical protein